MKKIVFITDLKIASLALSKRLNAAEFEIIHAFPHKNNLLQIIDSADLIIIDFSSDNECRADFCRILDICAKNNFPVIVTTEEYFEAIFKKYDFILLNIFYFPYCFMELKNIIENHFHFEKELAIK